MIPREDIVLENEPVLYPALCSLSPLAHVARLQYLVLEFLDISDGTYSHDLQNGPPGRACEQRNTDASLLNIGILVELYTGLGYCKSRMG